MVWFIWAIIASMCAAALAECNRIFRLDPQLVNAWRATIAAALLVVAIPHMVWSTDKWFYIVAALDGVVTAIGMVMYFKMAAQKTGRVSSIVIPLAAASSYLVWWMMRPDERPDILQHPWKVALASLSATLVMFAFQKVRDNDAGRDTFMMVLPVGIAFGVMNALTKNVMGHQMSLYAPAITYAFLQLTCCAIGSWFATIPIPAGGRRNGFFDKDLLWGGFCAGFFTVAMVLCSVFALTTAPQPALPQIIMACTPVWLFILNYFRNAEDDSSIPSSILIMLGAVGLLLSTLH